MTFLNKIKNFIENRFSVMWLVYFVLIQSIVLMGLGFFIANKILKIDERVVVLEKYSDSIARGNIPVLTKEGPRFFSLVVLNDLMLKFREDIKKLASGEAVEEEPGFFDIIQGKKEDDN